MQPVSKKDLLIIGSGYSGLNTYYEMNKGQFKVKIISSSDEFRFYSSTLRGLFFTGRSDRFKLPKFVGVEKVLEVDLSRRVVKTERRMYEPDIIVVASGCARPGLDQFLTDLAKSQRISIGAEYLYDEYIVLQAALYLKAMGKDVSYCGTPLGWLGKRIEDVVRESIEEAGVRMCETAEHILPAPKPSEPFERFLRVDDNLLVKGTDSSYAVGDAADLGPKLGELAMKMGLHVARQINEGTSSTFKPSFVNIIDTGRGKGMHLRSNILWGGVHEKIKMSYVRLLFKRFIEFYYPKRRGKMGFLKYL